MTFALSNRAWPRRVASGPGIIDRPDSLSLDRMSVVAVGADREAACCRRLPDQADYGGFVRRAETAETVTAKTLRRQ